MAAKDDYLLDQLIDLGFVTKPQAESLRVEADAAGSGIIDLLLERKIIRSQDLTTAKAAHFGYEVVNLTELRLVDEIISAIPRNVAKRYKAIPIFKHGHSITVALSDPADVDAIDGLTHSLRAEIVVSIASPEEIEAALAKYYGAADDSVSKMIQDITEGEVEIGGPAAAGALDDGSVVDADAPIIKLVNTIIVEAFRSRASDIHLEPLGKSFRVRYRIDGVLHEVKSPPKRLQASIVSRLKIQSNMSIAEKRIPQDGRIQTTVGGKMIDLRVSCLPTNHGESIVMRILDKEGLRLGLPELGFFTDDQQTFERLIGLPDGILLVTGPTGSGKTTTLYSCLHFI
ncbi:MAG TPA: ATPase, T2SS/T4P/T4SS family, partial [Candidatus Binatia bacterium]|nr:ATPase, T2SS/T4P/T4SS family [Candidatus Binatia bacterium]